MERLVALIRPGGLLVVSGIVAPRADEVHAALKAHGVDVVEADEEAGWCLLAGRRA
jgi:ribosomal protein L11 methylase PrmA